MQGCGSEWAGVGLPVDGWSCPLPALGLVKVSAWEPTSWFRLLAVFGANLPEHEVPVL